MTTYRVDINNKQSFETENVSVGHTAIDVTANTTEQIETLTITNTNLDVTSTYCNPHLDENGFFRYSNIK